MKKSILVFLLVNFGFGAQVFGTSRSCPDAKLIEGQWQIQRLTNLVTLEKDFMAMVNEHPEIFSEPSEYKMYSNVARRWVELNSIDNFTTRSEEMLGDILWIRDLYRGELLEIRWYENGIRHIAYDITKQKCATDVIPWVENSLY